MNILNLQLKFSNVWKQWNAVQFKKEFYSNKKNCFVIIYFNDLNQMKLAILHNDVNRLNADCIEGIKHTGYNQGVLYENIQAYCNLIDLLNMSQDELKFMPNQLRID